MAILRLFYGGFVFIIASLIFITTALSADKNTTKITDTIIYDDYVLPTHYNVKLIPYLKKNEKDKFVNFIFTNFKKYIEEHQANGRVVFYELIERDITSGSEKFYSNEVKIEYDNVTEILILYPKYEILTKSYILNIKFLNAINILEDDNIFLTTTYIEKSGDEKWWNKTHTPMIKAQRFFPYWDHATIRSDFDISIKHYCNYSVFSNVPVKNMPRQKKIYKLNNTEECMRWTYFGIKSFLPAHLAIIISPINLFPGCGTDRIHFWQNPKSNDIKFAERVSNKVIMKLKFEWFRKMKIPKLQLIAIPNFRNNINMNFGLVIIRDTNIFYNENLHSVTHKIEVARLITRGITYQWFDNLINRTSSNLWLNDGLITLIGMDVMNDVNVLENYKRNLDILNLFIVQTQYESFQLDDCNFTQTLTSEISYPEINSLSSYYRYIKAPLILRMLQYLVTEEVFWKSVRRYLYKSVLDWTTSDDFWYIIERTIYEKNHSERGNTAIKNLINKWEKKYANYPILKIMRNYNEKKMHITIENYYDFDKNDQLWIPITFTTQSNLNFMNLASPLRDERLRLIMSLLGGEDDIAEDGWVMFNIQQSGYYRVNYDAENWQRIAKYLNSTEYTKVHVLNRAKIIDDAFYFMITQQLESSIFWNLTSYLKQETSYIAWYPMIKAIEYMSSIFSFSDKRVDDIKKKLNDMLNSLLSKIRYIENAEENEFIECLREEAIKWACILGGTTCQKKDNIETENNDEIINKFLSTVTRHAKNDNVLTTILTQFETLKPKDVSTLAALTIIINHVYSKKQIDEIRNHATNITDRYAFARAKEISYTKNKTREVNIMEDFIIYKNLLKYFELCIKKKLEIRLSEIGKHMDYLRKF
ncbi:glutamyl aminopeptidase-like isoform X2 [Cataglyphis hispanica]|uniref:glutamyl aminopeptidase-like isoform X2 n=1 Tax=Cataglyphis hispanica TaxID=1086592 RepID=UPI00218070EB|nr:glutamyl aminopeptidase-like isoform X2 [Cataglyphis hispanica]